MQILGIDEAGYGPNLGPLVISGSAWSVALPVLSPGDPRETPLEFLTQRLVRAGAIAESLQARNAGKGAIFIADSKTIYKSNGSLESLLDAVLSVLEPVRPENGWTNRNLFTTLDPGCEAALNENPWDREYCEPLTVPPTVLLKNAKRFLAAIASEQIEPPQLFSKVVFPPEFNANVERFGSKGTAHAHWVLGLVRRILECLPPSEEPVLVLSDKLGARNRYAALIYTVFEDLGNTMIQTVRESAEISEYRFSFGNPALGNSALGKRTVNLSFQVRGERFLPVALASMTSKLLRELAMRSFNAFWQKRLPGLRETAGYPVDARRFRDEIAPLLTEISPDIPLNETFFWRCK